MTLLPRGSIRAKLATLLMIASTMVLVSASVAYVVWDYYRFRAEMVTALDAQAELVLDNTAAAMTFNDEVAAREGLEMLSINPNLRLACLYRPDRSLFTEVRFDDPSMEGACPAPAPPGSYLFTSTRLHLTEQLTRGRSTGGLLFLASDLEPLTSRLRTQGAAVLVILLLGIALSFLLSFLLQRVVAQPITSLAHTAREIADRGDYSIRATRQSDDEIGVLVSAFNRMLDEIETSQRERADLLEREQEANRLKDEFLATLSHELRTPLNAIVGWVHLLRTGSLPEDERRHAVERIDRNAQAQARLVQDLLDVSRITTGKLRLDIREMDLAVVATNAIDACRPAADARQVSITTQFSGTFPTCGDPDRVQQVIWNLLTNAVRFTPAGGKVTVLLSRDEGFDNIRVRDTGAGIDPHFVPFVFEPFRQADAASTRAHGGLGIGLTIVRRLTEMHGGTVGVWSDGPGLGATFTVTLPVRSTPVAASTDAEPVRLASLAGAQVLVVDDNPDTLELLESTLRMAGARPLPASSVVEAMHLVADGGPIDAVVSDIAMPGQDGYTLIALLKDRMGRSMPAATLALTAYAGAADRKRALDAGFREHLAKPVNPSVLVQTLEDMLAANATPPGRR
jgi:signal transduction histidine kinase/ActR/RegA family two-component response regulator